MTGVEGIGAIIGIADVATRVYLSTARFIQDCKAAGETRTRLYEKVTALNGVLEAVETLLTARRNQSRKPISYHEDDILKNLRRAMERCEGTVERLNEKVTSLGPGTREPNWRQRAILQLKLNVKEPEILRIERDMQADIGSLQVYLTCLSP